MLGYFQLYPSSVHIYIFGYNNTGYRDTPLTVTVLVNPMLPKVVTVRKYITVTLFSCPEGVNETKYVCNRNELT